ncbi:unnamed protein product [Fraxinus pennsylvanica]|uniref:Uncharacterized protein n=1 Tax=Fraxinus pennsylvanica TaxID=56036 RepID=A0AAD1Z993_9LAMI|nr:unnamed protein product [Fraxinus pennsylvanica]
MLDAKHPEAAILVSTKLESSEVVEHLSTQEKAKNLIPRPFFLKWNKAKNLRMTSTQSTSDLYRLFQHPDNVLTPREIRNGNGRPENEMQLLRVQQMVPHNAYTFQCAICLTVILVQPNNHLGQAHDSICHSASRMKNLLNRASSNINTMAASVNSCAFLGRQGVTIVRPLSQGTKLPAFIDACHSGTVDLPFLYRMNRSVLSFRDWINPNWPFARILHF